MGEVDQKDETKENENGGTDKGDIIAPEHEETVWDEERDNEEDKPK